MRPAARAAPGRLVETEADVADDARVERANAAIAIGGEPQPAAHVATVAGRLHVLAPCGGPAPGRRGASRATAPACPRRRPALWRRTAADARGEQVNALGRQLQPRRELVAHPVRHLRVAPHREPPGPGIPDRAARARLHGQRKEPLVHEVSLDDDCGAREGRLDVALLPFQAEREVRAEIRVEQGAPGASAASASTRWEVGSYSVSTAQRRPRRPPGCSPRRPRPPVDVAHTVLGEQRVPAAVNQVERRVGPPECESRDAILEIGGAPRANHAGHTHRWSRVDAYEPCVSMRATDDRHDEGAIEVHIVDVRSAPVRSRGSSTRLTGRPTYSTGIE